MNVNWLLFEEYFCTLQIDLPNSVHAFQTAERIRELHPDKGTQELAHSSTCHTHAMASVICLCSVEWFQVTGLIHDMGKVLALWGEPQWAVVGDTFPVGCQFSDKCVFYEKFEANPDNSDPRYK